MAVDVQVFSDLAAVAADARGRLDRDSQPSLFDRLEWFRLTLAHCPPLGALMVIRTQTDGAAMWAFLTVERGHARLLGSWYTLAGGFPLAPARQPGMNGPRSEPAVKTRLVEAIARTLRSGRIHHLMLVPVVDPVDLTAGFRAAGWRSRAGIDTWSWTIDVSGGWDAYWSARPAQLRATVRRKRRAAALKIDILDRFDRAAWAEYEAVYADSWKPPEGAPSFLRALAEQEGAAGTLRLGIARRAGRALAAQLWLVEQGRATIHKLAHRLEADALSPGTILSAAMFRHAIEADGVCEIDFGTGDEPYKADWMDRRAPLYRFKAFDTRTLAGLAGIARTRAAAIVHRLKRR